MNLYSDDEYKYDLKGKILLFINKHDFLLNICEKLKWYQNLCNRENKRLTEYHDRKVRWNEIVQKILAGKVVPTTELELTECIPVEFNNATYYATDICRYFKDVVVEEDNKKYRVEMPLEWKPEEYTE